MTKIDVQSSRTLTDCDPIAIRWRTNASIARLVYNLVYLAESTMKTEVGAYEAKTRLPELLRQVQAGRRYTITHRGKAIAELRPAAPVPALAAAAAIDRYLEFKRTHPVTARVNLKALMSEGRE